MCFAQVASCLVDVAAARRSGRRRVRPICGGTISGGCGRRRSDCGGLICSGSGTKNHSALRHIQKKNAGCDLRQIKKKNAVRTSLSRRGLTHDAAHEKSASPNRMAVGVMFGICRGACVTRSGKNVVNSGDAAPKNWC